jgi:hypothetical protein
VPISPWIVGQTHPTWQIPWTNESGPVDLTGATVTLWIFTREGASVQGGGTCLVVGNPTQGNVTYAPVAGDSPKAGSFYVALKAVYGDGSVLWQQPADTWTITTLP